jgi:hypothetical protein
MEPWKGLRAGGERTDAADEFLAVFVDHQDVAGLGPATVSKLELLR